MEFPIMTPDLCAQHARVLFKKDTGYSNKTDKELDKEIRESLIGTTYPVASELWNLINPAGIEAMVDTHINHLFWALLYDIFCVGGTMYGPNRHATEICGHGTTQITNSPF
jgi:hypothetical protein